MPEEQFQLSISSVHIHTHLATVVSKQLLPHMNYNFTTVYIIHKNHPTGQYLYATYIRTSYFTSPVTSALLVHSTRPTISIDHSPS